MTTATTAGLSPEVFAALSPVDQAIAIAKYQATHASNASSAAPVTDVAVVNTSTAVAMPTSGRKLTMEELATGTMAVDDFLKVSQFGLLVGKDAKKPVDTFRAKLLMVEGVGYVPNMTIKFGQNPVNYVKTYDLAKTANGKSWPAELERISRIDSNARPYPAADIALTLLADAGAMKAGQSVGHTTATTSFKHFKKLCEDVAQAGLSGKEVEVEVGFEARSKNNNNWGELKFKLIGLYEEAGSDE